MKRSPLPRSKRGLRYTPPRSGSYRELRDALDGAVSKHVRERDERCVLCGEADPQKLVAGHFFKRRYLWTRWHEKNVHAICKACNERDNREPCVYEAFIVLLYGVDTLDELGELAETRGRPSDEELRELLNTLTLNQEKPHGNQRD